MDFTASRNELSRVLSRCASVAASKSPIPIYTCVLIEVDGERLRARATDLFLGLETSCSAKIKSAGAVAIDARKAAEVAKNLPVGDVRVRLVENHVEMSSCKSKFKLDAIAGAEFPAVPSLPEATSGLTVNAHELARGIAQGAIGISTDESRPFLCGALFDIDGRSLRVVSADGSIAAMSELEVSDGELATTFVPPRALSEIRKLCEGASDDAKALIALQGGLVFAAIGDDVLSVKPGENSFPPYRKLFPGKSEQTVLVHRDSLATALKRASIASAKDRVGAVLEFSEGKLFVSSEDGAAEDELDCPCDFSFKIAGNWQLLHEAVQSCRDDEIEIGLNGQKGPIVFSGDGYTALVMPYRQAGAK